MQVKNHPVELFRAIRSDGTDGPTDVAGGIVDGKATERILSAGLDAYAMLKNNDSYHALEAAGDLFVTGHRYERQ